jgi:hypothetical protein
MLDDTTVGTFKVKFRVFETKQCRKCRKVHEMPTHRAIFHQAESTEYDIAQQGHELAVLVLDAEYRAQRRELKKAGKPLSLAVIKRPLYQYTLCLEVL